MCDKYQWSKLKPIHEWQISFLALTSISGTRWRFDNPFAMLHFLSIMHHLRILPSFGKSNYPSFPGLQAANMQALIERGSDWRHRPSKPLWQESQHRTPHGKYSIIRQHLSLLVPKSCLSALEWPPSCPRWQGVTKGRIGSHLHDAPLQKRLSVLSGLGLPIWLTEFDIRMEDEDEQVELFEDVLRLCFSHPSIHGIILWGFWNQAMGTPVSALMKGPNFEVNLPYNM